MDKKWSLRNLYLYLVSFVTLMMILVGTVQTVENLYDWLFRPPDIYGAPLWESKFVSPDGKEPTTEQLQTEALRQERLTRYTNQRALVGHLAMILVAMPVYLYHWRQIQKREEEKYS